MRWPMVPLGHLGANVPNACVGGPFGSDLTTRDYVGVGVPVIRGTNLGEDGFVDDGFVFVSAAKAEALRQNQAHAGDVVFTQRGTIGQVALIPESARFDRYVISQSQMKLTPDCGRIDPRFLVHFFKSPQALAHLRSNTLATGVPHINLTILRRVPVPLPPLDEQRRIADILDKADTIRRKRKEAIALTEELLRSTFLEMFGDPVTNPKGWPVKPLARIATITTGNTPPRVSPEYYGSEIEWIKSDNINTPSHFLTSATEMLSSLGKAVGRTAPPGSTLMTCIAGSPGCIGNVALADREVAFNQQINALTPLAEVDHRFLYALLWVGKPLVQAAATTSMKGMVSKGRLEAVSVPVPSEAMQRRFGKTFDHLVGLTSRHEDAERAAGLLFDSLVARAFAGELESPR